MAKQFSGYGTYDDLKDFITHAEVGQYYVNDELGIYANDFYFNESAQVWVGWYIREFFEDEFGEDAPDVVEELLAESPFDEIQVGPFYVILAVDYNIGEPGALAIYVVGENEADNMSQTYEYIATYNRRGDTYQDALEQGKSSFDSFELGQYNSTSLRLYDVLGKGDDTPIATKEI